uniref:ATP synthase F0 subunit 8 n=1 Tax=Elaphe quadrivirgata TaxID=86195 RepID=A0A7R7J471_ELAQU|nr:ATP synthase F0 subunit 8 [Elaphe quadrivirgata]
MPQLDTIYILMTHLWTWMTLYLMMQKVKTFTMYNYTLMTRLTPKQMTTLQWL